MDKQIVTAAHKLSTRQRRRYQSNTPAGCFHCEAVFLAKEIEEWCNEVEEREVTALCPSCAIDAVISIQDVVELGVSAEQFPVLLHAMRRRWFGD
ncbi:cytoplasmic protein [Roseibium aestuarii]|uniref:Cytoplasmic protein n=1 Tax=Roseibium aestuarii TaxID=2600299 RepID=A0ABW4JTL1_9HYPH|nr:cytoplasmic protein [Roseibium aestuarii]